MIYVSTSGTENSTPMARELAREGVEWQYGGALLGVGSVARRRPPAASSSLVYFLTLNIKKDLLFSLSPLCKAVAEFQIG